MRAIEAVTTREKKWAELIRQQGQSGSPVTTSIPVTAATNRLTNAHYDANGNMTSGGGATLTYDEANRISSSSVSSGGTEYYGYAPDAPDNKRVYRFGPDGLVNGMTEHLNFYGAYGEKLGVFWIDCTYGPCTFGQQTSNVWFAGKLIWENGVLLQDRLGTNRSGGPGYTTYSPARYYPYGDEITSTANDRTKFGTITGIRIRGSSMRISDSMRARMGDSTPRTAMAWE